MQLKSLYISAALLASIAFQGGTYQGRVYAQAVKPDSIMGTVTELRVQTHELVITTEEGNTLPVKVSMETEFLRVPPGVHDLSKAAPASPHDMKAGDHVLVSYADGMTEAHRVVFMSGMTDAFNGVSGTVSFKNGNELMTQLPGDAKSTIIVTPKTRFLRYSPDSVTIAQATPSTIAEIAPGDQIRARGEKSSDGLTITADEVVFGTFLTKAGTITAIDPNAHEITIQEVGTNKPLLIKVAADSKLKVLPSMHMGEGPGANSHGNPSDHVPMTTGGAVDISKILSSLPVCTVDDLKIGDAVLVSGPRGTAEGKITGIMLLANAQMFVNLMQQQAEGNSAGMEQFLKGHGLDPSQGMSLPSILQ